MEGSSVGNVLHSEISCVTPAVRQRRTKSHLEREKARWEKMKFEQGPDLTIRGVGVRFGMGSQPEMESQKPPELLLRRDFCQCATGLALEASQVIGNVRTAVDLRPFRVDAETMRWVAQVAPIAKVLDVSGCAEFNVTSLVSYVTKLKERPSLIRLKHVDLSGWQGKPMEINTGVAVLSATVGPRLRSLEIRHTMIGDEALAVLADRCRNLRYIDMSDCPLITDQGISLLLRSTGDDDDDAGNSVPETTTCHEARFLNQVRQLKTSNCERVRGRWFINASALAAISVSSTYMVEVDLSGCALVKDIALEECSISTQDHLQTLNVSKCPEVGDMALVALASRCANLRKLNLRDCQLVSDEGILALCTGNMDGLSYIDLTNTRVTDVGISALLDRFFGTLEVLIASSSNDIEFFMDHKVKRYAYGDPVQRALHRSRLLQEEQGQRKGEWAHVVLSEEQTRNNNQQFVLEVLDLSGHALLKPQNIASFVEHKCGANLVELNLAKCELVDDTVLKAIANYCQAKLLSLNLSACTLISDQGLGSLATGMLHLRTLDLSFCPYEKSMKTEDPISEEAITTLLSSLDDLQNLTLRYRSHVTFQSTHVHRSNRDENNNDDKFGQRLLTLDLEGCDKLQSDGLNRALVIFPKLQEVKLSQCFHLTHEDLRLALEQSGRNIDLLEVVMDSSWFGLKATEKGRRKKIYRDLGNRIKQEHRSAGLIQQRFRAFMQAEPTLEYILIKEKTVVEAYALSIQRMWRKRRQWKFTMQLVARIRSAKKIQRMIRTHNFRKAVGNLLVDRDGKSARERLAMELKLRHVNAKFLQKWYRHQLWHRSEEGLYYARLMEEAKEELQWRRKSQLWKQQCDGIITEAVEKALHWQRYRFAFINSKAPPVSGHQATSNYIPEAKFKPLEYGPETFTEYDIPAEPWEVRRPKRKFTTFCSFCKNKYATYWCALCMNVLCEHCTFVDHRHQEHVRTRNDPNRDRDLIRRIVSVDAVEKTLVNKHFDASIRVMGMREALGPVTEVIRLRSLLMTDLHEYFKKMQLKRRQQATQERKTRQRHLEQAASLVQSTYRRKRAQGLSDVLRKERENAERQMQLQRKEKSAIKIQALARGRPCRVIYRKLVHEEWSKRRITMTEKCVELQDALRPYHVSMTRRKAKDRVATIHVVAKTCLKVYRDHQRSMVTPQLKLALDRRRRMTEQLKILEDEVQGLQQIENKTSQQQMLLRISVARRGHCVNKMGNVDRLVYMLESQHGEAEQDRNARRHAARSVFIQNVKRIRKQIQRFEDLQTILKRREAELLQALERDVPAAFKTLYLNSSHGKLRAISEVHNENKDEDTLIKEKLFVAANCELEWIRANLGFKSLLEIRQGKALKSETQTQVELKKLREVAQAEQQLLQQKLQEEEKEDEQEQDDDDESNDSEDDDLESIHSVNDEPKENDEAEKQPKEEAEEEALGVKEARIAAMLAQKELEKREAFEKERQQEQEEYFKDMNIPSELNRYWTKLLLLAEYELKRLKKLLVYERQNENKVNQLLGLFRISDSFTDELLTVELQKLKNERIGRNDLVMQFLQQEEQVRGKIVKLNGKLQQETTSFFTSVRQFERHLESITRKQPRNDGSFIYRGVIPLKMGIQHKLASKTLLLEMQTDAWTALLPPRYFADRKYLEKDQQLQERLQSAMNARVAAIQENLAREDGVDEEALAMKELNERGGAVVAELLNPEDEEASPGDGGILSRFKRKLNGWLFNTEEKELIARLEQSVLSRQRTEETKRIRAITVEMAFTVGNTEIAMMEREQQLRHQEDLPFLVRLTKNLGKDYPIYLWYRTSVDCRELVTGFKLSHASNKHRLHRRPGNGYRLVAHKAMDGLPGSPGLQVLVQSTDPDQSSPVKVRYAKEFTVTYNEIEEKDAESKGFEPINPDFGQFNLAEGVRFWIRWSEKVTLGDAKKGTQKNESQRIGNNLDLDSLEKKKNNLQRRIKEEADTMEPESLERLLKLLEQVEYQFELACAEEESRKKAMLKNATEFLALSTKELKKLVRLFAQMDSDSSGEISIDELHDFLGMERTNFSEQVFYFLDRNKDGTYDFPEFVTILSSFCLFTATEITKMCFTFLQPDEDGLAVTTHLEHLMSSVHGVDPQELPVLRNMLSYCSQVCDEKGRITLDHFVQLGKKYPAALYPAVKLRDKMREKFLGTKWWENRLDKFSQARKRVQAASTKSGLKLPHL